MFIEANNKDCFGRTLLLVQVFATPPDREKRICEYPLQILFFFYRESK
jgi:hypothetical protein